MGLAVADGQFLRSTRAWGPDQDGFAGPLVSGLSGSLAIGQVHYRAPGGDGLDGGDRLVSARYDGGQLAVALTGRFTNGASLRKDLKARGALFQTTSDAEVVAHLIAHSTQRTDINRLVDALWQVKGGWSALICSVDRMVAVRDPRGFRPLWMGADDEVVWFASDEAAIRFAGGTPQRELDPGEMAIVDMYGVHCVSPFARRPRAGCVQEFVSLARGDGRVFGLDAWSVRVGIGERMAREAPAPRASVVVGVPGPGEAMASGYGRVARIPVERGLIDTPVSRPLTEPPSGIDDFTAHLRWTVVPSVVAERAVCLVAPSAIPNERMGRLVRMLREAGATEVHLRVASPPLRNACAYGVVMPTRDELVSDGPSDNRLGVDTFDHLSLEGLHAVVGRRVDDTPLYCDACFSGRHPVPPEVEPSDDQLQLF